MPLRWGIAALACLLIIAAVGCSTVTEKPSASVEDTAAQCEQLFRTLDTAVDRAGVRDGGTARIDGFPYLRANRILASYRYEPMSRRQELWWIDRLKGLDVQARAIFEAAIEACMRLLDAAPDWQEFVYVTPAQSARRGRFLQFMMRELLNQLPSEMRVRYEQQIGDRLLAEGRPALDLFAGVRAALERSTLDGRVEIDMELVYGHCWGADVTAQSTDYRIDAAQIGTRRR